MTTHQHLQNRARWIPLSRVALPGSIGDPPGVETIFTPMNMRWYSTGILQFVGGLKSIKPLALQAITASRNPNPFNTV